MHVRNLAALAALAVAGSLAATSAMAQAFESTIPAKPNFTVKLPADVVKPGALNVGIRCDYPPFGSLDTTGKNVGIEVDLAKALAFYAFGDSSKIKFTCVTSANRIPNLITSKVDIVIANMAYTAERAKSVQYVPQMYTTYYVEFLTEKNGPKDFTALKGKTVSTVIGGVYEPWFKKCMPDVKVLGFSTIDQAFEAFQQGRSAAIAHDNTVLAGILARGSNYKLSADHIIPGYIGMAVRPGSDALAAWLNEAVVALNGSDFYLKSLERNVDSPVARTALKNAMPYPGHPMPTTAQNITTGGSCDLIPSS